MILELLMFTVGSKWDFEGIHLEKSYIHISLCEMNKIFHTDAEVYLILNANIHMYSLTHATGVFFHQRF